MSLKVWLPLNGDLHNQGCTGYTITAIEASPTFTAGKIGQCYQRANTSSQITNGLQIQDNLVSTFGTAASVAVWVKPLGTHTHYNGTILSSGDWNRKRWAFGVSQDNSQVDVLCGGHNNYISCAVPVNQWTHLASTFENGVCKLYKNGVYIGEKSGQAAFDSDANWTGICRETYASGYFGFNGCINDLRIYDHALSAAEVKEISQGLVLHYKLDTLDIQSGTNLVTGVTAGGRTTVLTDGRVGVQTTGVNQDTYFSINLSENIVAGTSYLFICDASGISNGQYWGFPLGAQANSGVLPFKIYNGHNVYPFTANSTKSDGTAMDWGTKRLFMDDNYRGDWANQACFYNFQLIKIGASDTIIKVEDSSGYNHNGTINGNIVISSDTNRYNCSTQFDGVDDSITVPYNAICPENIFTFNLWFKKDALGSKNYETLFGGPSGFEMDTRAGSATTLSLYMTSTRSTKRNLVTELSLGNWYMITMTRDGTKEKYYVNGIYQSEIDAKAMPTGVYRIGAWASNTGQNYYGLISDFRIYCTALSADDILQLYHTSAKIDNEQNIHTYELVEGGNKELLAVPLTTSYGNHNTIYTAYNNNGEVSLTGGSSVGSYYIPINPTGKTYYYDIEVSTDAGNVFYIGFQRYDANKTARSNDACVYLPGLTGSSEARTHKHYFGTVDLSTDGVNPCAFISLRILNDWSGANGRNATIHKISLREVTSLSNEKILKSGIFKADEFIEGQQVEIQKNKIVRGKNLIEF